MLVDRNAVKSADKSQDSAADALGRGHTPQEKPRLLSRGAADRRFHGALFSYHRGDYRIAAEEFAIVSEAFEILGDRPRFVECCYYRLRILAEREDFKAIAEIEKRLNTVIRDAPEDAQQVTSKLRSRAVYALGICACYRDDGHEQAMQLFRESIELAVQSGDKEALASPLYGCATVLYAQKRYDEALRELGRLDILISCLGLPELSSASRLLRAMIYRNLDRVDEALESGWTAYEALKELPHLVLYLHTLTVLGSLYILKGDVSCARLYLELADRSLKRTEFPRLARLVDESLAQIRVSRDNDYDLTFDSRTGVLIERNKGEIRFDGQFILRDLLRLFMENPGVVFTKEDLATRVWRESYSPEIHDNKIYVTIKRLRKLLEPEESSSQKASGKSAKKSARRSSERQALYPTDYIMRAKAGYFLNPKVRIMIDAQPVKSPNEPVREDLK